MRDPRPDTRERAVESVVRAGDSAMDFLTVNQAERWVDAAVPVVLDDIEALIEAMKPHIPPSTDPKRREAIIIRGTLNKALRGIRSERVRNGWSRD